MDMCVFSLDVLTLIKYNQICNMFIFTQKYRHVLVFYKTCSTIADFCPLQKVNVVFVIQFLISKLWTSVPLQ